MQIKLDFFISLWNYIHYNKLDSLEETIKEIKTKGFGVEIWPWWKENKGIFNEAYRNTLREILKNVPCSFHSEQAKSLSQHKTQIDTANYVGSSLIVVHPEELKIDGINSDFSFAQQVVNYAKEKGIIIALENMPTDEQLVVLEKCLEKVEGLTVCFDIGHAYLKNLMKECLLTLKEKISHLHLHDIEFTKDHFVIGKGNISFEDWQYLFYTLEEISFKGAAVFEIKPYLPLENAYISTNFLRKFFDVYN